MNAPENKAVFLSYASQDAEPARRICETLRAAGVEVWFDQSELRGGDAWDAKIRKQIKECALFVPVISANTQARREGYFRLEWRLADQRTHLMSHDTPFIVPVVIDETRDHDARVPESFLAVQWTRLPHGQPGPTFGERVMALLDGGDVDPRPSSGAVVPGAHARSAASGSSKISSPRKRTRIRLLLSVAVVSAALIGFALRQPGRSPHPISPQTDASQRTKESAETSASFERAPSPAVTALLTRARALAAKTDVVRSDLDTAASCSNRRRNRNRPMHAYGPNARWSTGVMPTIISIVRWREWTRLADMRRRRRASHQRIRSHDSRRRRR